MVKIKRYKPPELLSFNVVRVNIPRRFILRSFETTEVSRENIRKIGRKKRQIEQAINNLRHVDSIVDKILLKHTNKITSSLK